MCLRAICRSHSGFTEGPLFHLCDITQSINQISYFMEGFRNIQLLIKYTKNVLNTLPKFLLF